MQEGRDVLNLLQHLSVVGALHEVDEFLEDLLDVVDLLLVAYDDLLLVHEPLLLSLVLALELRHDVSLLLLDLPYQFCKPVLNVVQLDLHESFKLLLHLREQALVVSDEPIGVVDHFSKVDNVLLQAVAHLFDLHQ